MKSEKLLLEIGTEEIPARFLPGARSALAETLKGLLGENYIDCGEKPSVYATPRRLAVILDVAVSQRDRVREAFGPPKSAAYDRDGNLTKAAEGFARTQGVRPEDLVIKTKGKGEYVAAVVEEKGRPTVELLPGILRKLILSLHFPKSMRWGNGEIRFARPIHWIVALYGGDVVRFEIDGIKSGNRTYGHRFLSHGAVEVRDAEQYVDALKRNNVLVDQNERVSLIEEQAGALAASVSGTPYYMHEYQTREVADLVEYPRAVLGSFDGKYLELPEELLSSVMWGHQKYFPVKDARGNLKSNFIIISNTSPENDGVVRCGAERVIRARFEDARFYFEEDRARTLESRVEDLKKVTFHEKLGSLHDKTMRVKALAELLAGELCPEKKDLVMRAATLSKTDLTTGVVYEFPELQGVMGMYYALNDGEGFDVAYAIRDHYHPAFAGDDVPESDVACIVGLADRADNIAAFFSIGLKPTGSEDPFALRRQALAAISILMEKGYPVSLGRILRDALAGLGGLRGPGPVEREALDFFSLRLEGVLTERGYSPDLVQSVMGFAAESPLGEVVRRLDALKEFKSHPAYGEFLTAIKRVRNIVPEAVLPPVERGLLMAAEEKALFDTLDSLKDVEALVERGEYAEALERLPVLTSPINDFFDKVLVMDKDERIKNNRLSLLKDIWATASSVADFSKLSEPA